MTGKVKAYLKKGLLMLLISAMVCSNSGISALATTTVVAVDEVLPDEVSGNSAEQPQADEPHQQQEEITVEEVDTAAEPDVPDFELPEFEHEAEGSDSTEVEYIYAEGSTSVSAINLNGNSVIIRASANDTNEKRLINIIIDKDKDGVIDDGEEPVEIDGSADLLGGPAIYGYYCETEVTNPISITSISGYTPVIFGVYKSSLQTSGETAVTMRLIGGEVLGYFYAANESQVISTGAPAVEMYVDTEATTSTSQIMGAVSSEVKVSGTDKPGVLVEMNKGNAGSVYGFQGCSYTYKESTSAAVQMDINGGGVSAVYGIQGGQVISDGKETTLFDMNLKASVNAFYGSYAATLNAGAKTVTAMDIDVTGDGAVTGNGYGVYGGSSNTTCLVTGNVDINYAPDAGTETNINSFYGVSQYLRVDGNVTMKLKNARGYRVYAAYYCDITGNVTLDVPKGNELTDDVYGLSSSRCGGDLTVRVYGCTENTNAYNDIYGINGRYGNEPMTTVGGDFTFEYLGGRGGYVYGGYGYWNSNGIYDKIGGKADITIRKGDINSLYLLEYFDVTGDINGTVGDFTTDLTVSGNELESCVISSSFYPIYYCNAKNVTYKARITNGNDDYKPYHQGVYNCKISGDVKVEIDGGCYNYLYGVYSSTVGGNVDVSFKNINKENEKISSSSGTTYGVYYGNVDGNINITAEDSKFYGFYATSCHGCSGNITSSVKNVDAYNYLYGPNPNNCEGDVVSTIENASGGYVYGVYQSGNIGGNVTSALKNVTMNQNYTTNGCIYGFSGNSSYTVGEDVKVTMEDCSFANAYGISGGAIEGNLEVDITGGTYGSTTTGTYNYFASPSYVKGTTTIDVADATYYGNVYPYSGWYSSSGSGDVTITVENTQFNTGYYPDSEQIAISPSAGQTITMTLDEDCSIAETLDIYAGSGSGEGKILYDGETYIGGAIRFAEDTTYDAIHFSGGSLHIDDGVTLKIDEFYWDSGNILLDGTLDAKVMNDVDEETGKYLNTTVYMAGGTMNVDLEKIQTVYWPFEVDYKAKGGTVAENSSYSYRPSTHALGGNRLFAKVGQEIKYNISAAEGYTLASVTYTANEERVNVPNSGTTYTITMPNAAVSLDVDFEGNQIVVGKTVTDPVLKLNVATTAEAPAYDLSSLSISNDGELGAVSYKVDSTYGLPEGLSLEEDKIIGTPTVAYESGKKTIIHVTGKNDTSVELSINFVVTEGEGVQTSQDGRITVDETNLMIYLNNNSVIVETQDNQTALYLDDNRDGKADYETPAVVGDFTNYTMYGNRNMDTTKPISITMNGGTIGGVVATQNGDITASGTSIGVYVNGGSIGTLNVLDSAKTTGDIEVVIATEATVTSKTVPTGTTVFDGCYYDDRGTVKVYGNYDFDKDITANILWLYGNHTIPKGVTVTVTSTLYCDNASIIKLKGTLTAASRYVYSSYYRGKLLMMGGSIPDGEDNTWAYVYYPAQATTNVKNTYVTYSSAIDYYDLTEDGVKTRYVRSGSVQFSITQPSGYDYYYSLNEGDPVAVTSPTSFYVNTAHKANTIEILYVPKQIELVKLFADPTGVVGKEYTAEAPLYDLRGLTILNDTVATYGGDVKYTLKSTSKLPAGLTFEDGRIIGTPTTVNTKGTEVSFVVTGRNGTTETVDVVLKIADAGYTTKDINDLVSVKNSEIDLQGTSVAILEDPANSNCSQIFLDENQDGTADNNNPLKIGSSTSHYLNNYTIYGYTGTEEAYEGDITITVKGGKLYKLYGVKGTGAAEAYWAKVNGTVTINLGDAYMSGTGTQIYGVYYGQAENVKLSVYDGSYSYTDFYGAYGGKITGNLDYEIKDDSYFYGSSGSSYRMYFYPAYSTTIEGNANIVLGVNASGNLTTSNGYRYSEFNGLRDCIVGGNVNYDIDGYWYTGDLIFLYGSTVNGNFDIDIASGSSLYSYDAYPLFAYSSSQINGDFLFDIDEDASFAFDPLYFLYNSSAKNLRINVPKSCTSSMSTMYTTYGTGAVTEGIYINNKGNISIGGTCTISEDIEAPSITVLTGAKVTIAEGVTVKTTQNQLLMQADATLINNGTIDSYTNANNEYGIQGTLINNGVLNNSGYSYSYYFSIYTTGTVINKEGAQWNVNGRLYNRGKIVNYGDFVQTYTARYNYLMGTVFTTTPLTLSWIPATSTYYRPTYEYPYSTFYYAAEIQYPSHCTDSVVLSGDAVATSGVEGDTNQYVKALGNSYTTPTFTVTVGETKLDTVTLTNVTYGPDDTVAAVNTDGKTWTGQATGIFEPFTVSVNYDAVDEETMSISLNSIAERIENTDDSQPLVYNKYYSYSSPLFNLANLTITNDLEGDGDVIYYLDSSSSLPTGMYLKEGRLYGTLKEATTEDQDIVFIVKGKNQTTAFFTLTLGPVAKQVPAWAIPTNLSGLVGDTLADVSLPYSSYGTYSWADATVSLGNEVKTLEDQTLLFTPSDTANLDWAAVAEKNGATYADGVITCKADVKVCAGTPTYTAPSTITTTYGKTFGEVPIPAGDNDGTFEWYYASTTKVGNVGTYTRWVTYIPNDENYQTVYYIQVTLVVEKAIPTYERIDSVSQECGSTLADIILPDVEGGKYQWITTATTIPLDGKTYQVGFKPNDTTNYDWSKIEGWNEAWKCVVFPITVNLNHTYSTELTYDETYHWYPCLDETCDSVEEKEEHLWDEGFVLEEATMEEEGLIEYSCECGASYEEVIPKLTHPKHIYSGAWKYDADGHWKQCTYTDCVETSEPEDHEFDEGVPVSAPTASQKGVVKYTCEICKYEEKEYLDEEEWENSGWAEDEEEEMVAGDEFEDPDTNAEYEVAEGEEEVIFLAPDKNTYTKFTVPSTVEFDGVYYKVTEIAPNAFKGNKKLKSIKIGSNIKTIGTRAFYGCSGLTTVTMGSKVATIGNSAFQNCTSLKKIVIPKTVTKIGSKAFSGCKKLLNMTIKTTKLTEKNVGKKAFSKMGSSNYKKVKVKVPKKKLKVYKKLLVKRGLSKQAKVKK